ncbi:hypothetical protein DER44DRAFT_679857 [Fusarium oxysporum]|nr:hypothetical protein DER44DRAFT_679857 [Fusarium oxysporum]
MQDARDGDRREIGIYTVLVTCSCGCIFTSGNCRRVVAIRVPFSNGLINNAKIHQAVTTESPPFPRPYPTSDYVD